MTAKELSAKIVETVIQKLGSFGSREEEIQVETEIERLLERNQLEEYDARVLALEIKVDELEEENDNLKTELRTFKPDET